MKLLNNFGKTRIPMITQSVAMFLHPVWCYFLVSDSQLDMGITGIGIAGIITNLSVFVYNLVYSFYEVDVR